LKIYTISTSLPEISLTYDFIEGIKALMSTKKLKKNLDLRKGAYNDLRALRFPKEDMI
jgi:hypothetical protein